MSKPTTQAIATLLDDVIRRLTLDHAGRTAGEHDGAATCAACALIERAQHLAAALAADPDAPLFEELEQAGASDAVSNTVDRLEDMLLATAPAFKVDPKSLLRAVIVTAQQRLDWGYGPIGGAHASPTEAGDAPETGQPPADVADSGPDDELSQALDEAAVAIEIDAELLLGLRPELDKERAIQRIVARLRDKGWAL